MKIYEFEYEVPPLNKIHRHGVAATDKETAIKKFKANNPGTKIRMVKIRQEY